MTAILGLRPRFVSLSTCPGVRSVDLRFQLPLKTGGQEADIPTVIVRLISLRWWIGTVMAWCVLVGDFSLMNIAAADDGKGPEAPIPLTVTNRTPAEPAGNIGSNTVAAGLISAPASLSAERVRRIQIVQRIEPEIVQIFPSLAPARLD